MTFISDSYVECLYSFFLLNLLQFSLLDVNFVGIPEIDCKQYFLHNKKKPGTVNLSNSEYQVFSSCMI